MKFTIKNVAAFIYNVFILVIYRDFNFILYNKVIKDHML